MMYLKAVYSFLLSVLVTISCLLSPTPADTASARITSERCYTLDEAYVMGQGLDFEDGIYYTSGALSAFKIAGLAKVDAETGEIIGKELFALGKEFTSQGYDHIGDISVQNGIIYAPVEDKAEEKPLVLLYDAETLKFTGTYYEVGAEYLTDGIPWCATDDNYLYASQFNKAEFIVAFNIEDMSFSHIIPLSKTIYRVQSGDCADGKLYANCDPKNANKEVYEIDLATGEVTLLFDRNTTGYDTETEGMAVITENDGSLTFAIADYDKLISTFVRTYKLK